MTDKPDPTRNWSFLSKFASLLVAGTALLISNFVQADTPTLNTYTTAGSGTWACPAGVNLVQVEVWGGGGGGGGSYKPSGGKNGDGGGGGGGAYASFNAYLVSAGNYSFSVGTAGAAGANPTTGTGGNGGNGSDSWFVSNITLDASGGAGGTAGIGTASAGGVGTGGNGGAVGTTGDNKYTGGNGAAASTVNSSGGGGSSGANTGNGMNASFQYGGSAVGDGGGGGNGGPTTTPSVGSTPGGGGGGSRTTSAGSAAGLAGGSGQVQFTYYVTPSTQASGVSFSSVGSANMVVSWASGNGGSSLVLVKAGSAVNSAPVNGTIYTPNTVFGSGSQLGTGNYAVYQGTGSTVTISGLAVGTTYYVAVYAVNGAGTVLAEYLTSSPATGSQTTVSVPSLTSPTKSGLELNSVTLGATVSSANGATITEYGIVWNTSGNPTTLDHKIIAGTSVAPPSTFTVSATGLPVSATIYYAGYATSSAGTGYSLSDSFTYSPQLAWAATGSGTWNVNSSGNLVWQDSAANTTYYQDGDQAVFNDTGSGTVALNSAVNPASLMVSNNVSTYTITGSGAIAGAISLTKLGTNTLTLATANTYTGGTTNGAGTLILGNAAALGTGTLTMNGGNLDSSPANLVNANNNPQAWNADFTFAGSQNLNLGNGNVTLGASRQVTVSANTLTVGGVISGANFGLTKSGNGTLILNTLNTYAGGTTVNGGVLALPSNNGSGGVGSIIGSLTVNSGAEAQSGNSWSLGYGKNYVTNIFLNGGTLTFTGGSSYPNDTGFAGTNLTMSGATVQANNGGSGFDFYSGSGSSQTTYVNVVSNPVVSVISCQMDLRVGGSGSVVFNVAGSGSGNDVLISGNIVPTTAARYGGSIVKTGAGVMTLSAINPCTNSINLNAGKLVGVTSGSCSNSAFTVASGATNTVKLAGAGGQFTCNGLTYNSGTSYQELDFQNYPPSTTTAPLNVTGTGSGVLTANNTVNLSLLNAPAWTSVGTYPLIHYTATDPIVSSFNLLTALPGNFNGSVIVDGGNKNVSLAINLIAPNLSYTNVPGVPRIITLSDIAGAGLQSLQSSPSYSFMGVSATSTAGGSVIYNAGNIEYAYPASGNPASDSFTYTVSDGAVSATATVTITFASAFGSQLSTTGTDGSGHPVIKFHGIPGYTYHMQRASSLSPANWMTLPNTVTCAGNGVGTWTDTNTPIPNPVFYRLTYP